MRVIVTSVALGHWYPRGIERMRGEFRHWPQYELMPYVDSLPPGMSGHYSGANGWDYTAYAAKPWALLAALRDGADVAILLDASFYPVRDIAPLVEHIAQTGYYLCRNGFPLREWVSDACLETFSVPRESLAGLEDVSSYCVGIRRPEPGEDSLADLWAAWSIPQAIVGHHTAPGYDGRNKGRVSRDPRVRGHRHDQSVLSLLVHRLGLWGHAIARPRFTAYAGHETEETVLVCRGLGK